jgi:signal peptidase I
MKTSWKEVVLLGGCVLLVALVYITNPFHTDSWDPRIRVCGFTIFRAPSRSMEPTIPENSIFLVSAWAYIRSEPRAGDIVVFKYPPDPTVAYVKRIIAIGGSTVEIADGVVLVDGQPLSQRYVAKDASTSTYSRFMRRVRVPPKSYFVMGDNRDNSTDSRSWGFLPRDHIIGEVGTILLRTN